MKQDQPGKEIKCGNFQKLMDFLPPGYKYIVDDYEELTTESFLGVPPFAFKAVFWVQVNTSETVQALIRMFEEMTKSIF